jgi:hypothetical protein
MNFFAHVQADDDYWDVRLRFSDFVKFDGSLQKMFSQVQDWRKNIKIHAPSRSPDIMISSSGSTCRTSSKE